MYLGVTNITLDGLKEEKQSPNLSDVLGTPAEFHHRDHVSSLNWSKLQNHFPKIYDLFSINRVPNENR